MTASAYGLTTPHGPDWLANALCASPEYADERDVWFAQKKDKAAVRRARQICWLCPVLAACGQWAYETREPFGTWGAVSESERRAMLRRRGIRLPYEDEEPEPPKPNRNRRGPSGCGTRGGYSKHCRENTEPCTACRAANAERQRQVRRTGFSTAAAP